MDPIERAAMNNDERIYEECRAVLRRGWNLSIRVWEPCADPDNCDGPDAPRDPERPMFTVEIDRLDPDGVGILGGACDDDLVEAIRDALAEAEENERGEYEPGQIDDEPPPDYGPPGSGAVITEYQVGTYEEPW